MKRLVLSFAAVFTLLILAAVPVAAVEYGGVGGQPANPRADSPRTHSIFIYNLKPGQSASDAVKIFNNTNKTRTITVDAVDSELASGGTFTCAQASEAKTGVGSWINLSAAEVTIAANDSKIVPFTITAPGSAAVGEHDGCITMQDKSSTENLTKKSGVILGFRSGIRVVATVPGKIVKKLEFSKVAVSQNKDGDYVATPTIQSSSNVSLDTSLTANLDATFGAGGGKSAGGTYPILPRSSASWNFDVGRPFWGGWFRAKVSANYNASTASTLGQSGGVNKKTITASSAVFFAAPKPLALAIEIIIILIILVLIALAVRKQRDVKHIRSHWKDYSVKKNETINDMARKHHVSWNKLARVNRLKAPYSLKAGQKLKIPQSPKAGPKTTAAESKPRRKSAAKPNKKQPKPATKKGPARSKSPKNPKSKKTKG